MQRNVLRYAVVAALALAVGAAGSAGAAALITGKSIKNGSIGLKDLSKKARVKLMRGHTGPQGLQGPPGTQGLPGAPGQPGAPGSARAYARVDDSGGLDSNRSKGFTGITRPDPGLTCLTLDPATGIDKTKTAWSATVDYNTSPGNAILAFAAPFQCQSDQIGVLTAEIDGGTFSFQTLSFTVVVP